MAAFRSLAALGLDSRPVTHSAAARHSGYADLGMATAAAASIGAATKARRAGACAAVVLVAALLPPLASEPGSRLPDRLQRYVDETVRPSAAEWQRLLGGEPFTKLLEADPSREVAVFGVVWVNAPRRAYAAAVANIERYERGRAFLLTRRIGTPPALADFADLRLSEDEVGDLRACRAGDCKLKLDRETIERIRAQVDFGAPTARQDAEAVLRQRLLEYVTRYHALGNGGLVEYYDDEPPVRASEEVAALLASWPSLLDTLPELRQYLADYPRAAWRPAIEVFYWQQVRFGLKPTIRISHLVVHEGERDTVVASKMLYANHYFRSALELRVLVSDPDRGPGYWLVTISRSRPDGLTGFLGRLLRGRVRNEARKGVHDLLVSAKRRLEGPVAP